MMAINSVVNSHMKSRHTKYVPPKKLPKANKKDSNDPAYASRFKKYTDGMRAKGFYPTPVWIPKGHQHDFRLAGSMIRENPDLTLCLRDTKTGRLVPL